MKFIFLFLLLILGFGTQSDAQLPNQGCNNGSRIYTQYLGTTTWFGVTHDVYSSTGNSYRIYNNEDGKNVTPCNEIRGNPRDWTDAGGNQCWIADRVPPTNNQQNSDGTFVSWQTKVNINSGAVKACNVPLDDYSLYMLIILGGIGTYFIRKRLILNMTSH